MSRKKKRKAFKDMQTYKPIRMPWNVARLFPEGFRNINTFGNQASLGEDYVSLEEMQEALDWLVDQFGGKVDWT